MIKTVLVLSLLLYLNTFVSFPPQPWNIPRPRSEEEASSRKTFEQLRLSGTKRFGSGSEAEVRSIRKHPRPRQASPVRVMKDQTTRPAGTKRVESVSEAEVSNFLDQNISSRRGPHADPFEVGLVPDAVVGKSFRLVYLFECVRSMKLLVQVDDDGNVKV